MRKLLALILAFAFSSALAQEDITNRTTVTGAAGNIAITGTGFPYTVDLATGRKLLSSGCAINSTAAATCADGSAGANNGTYTVPTGTLWLEGEMVGGGGGGCGSGTTPGTVGAAVSSTFSTFTATNAGSCSNAAGGSGGIPTGATAFLLKTGGVGGNGSGLVSTAGGTGCGSPYGGAGIAGAPGAGAGTNASANTGSGGGGAGVNATINGGGGGGCAGFIRFIIQSPAASYSYTIGAGGTGATAGIGGAAGGNGGSGFIQIIPHFN